MEAEGLKFDPVPVSVIIPAFNEEEGLQAALDINRATLAEFLDDYEIIIVNDGSTDGTQEIIDRNKALHPELICYRKPVNEGLGSAVKKGIELAGKAYVLPVPVDSPLDRETLSRLLGVLNGHDIVVGYRRERLGYSLRMKINSRVFHKLVRMMFRLRLKDYNWIHLYRKSIFSHPAMDFRSKGILMLAEVLVRASRLGFSLAEVEVRQRARLTGTATASKLSTVFKTFAEMMSLYRELRRNGPALQEVKPAH